MIRSLFDDKKRLWAFALIPSTHFSVLFLLLLPLLPLHRTNLLDLVLLQFCSTVNLICPSIIVSLLKVQPSLSLSANQLHPNCDKDDQDEGDGKHLLGHDCVVDLEEGEVLPGEDLGHLCSFGDYLSC